MKISDIFSEGWSNKYKRSIDCSNPKGFSQKAHCAGRKKNESVEQGVAEDTIRPNFVAALKGLGFKGPFKLEQLPEWMKELSDERFDKDTSIMIGGDDPAYDAWVAKGYDYGYAYGMESGYQTGLSAQQVLRQAKSDMQGVTEGFNGISVDIEPELDYDVVYVDINGKKYNFNYWYADEKPTNELEFRKDIPQYLKREEWYNKLDFPTKMEVLHAVVQAELGNDPSEYRPRVGDEPMDEEKQRLDPKCWDGYKKQGTKMKGGVRVNNCVPKD